MHGGEKEFRAERLDEEGVRERESGVAALVFLAEAADGDDLHGRVQALDDARKRGAVEIRHAEVGDDDADLAGAWSEERNALSAVAGGEDAVAVPGENRSGHVANARLVVDHEDEIAVAAGLDRGRARGCDGRGRRRAVRGKEDAEGGALS